MNDKDSFFTFTYKTCYIHTCRNICTGREEITVQISDRAVPVTCKTLQGAKRYITKELARRTALSDACMTRIAEDQKNGS